MRRVQSGNVSVRLLGLDRCMSRLGGGAVCRGQQHGEEQQHRYQQVWSIYEDQEPALLQSLGTTVGFHRELIEKDVG